MKTILTTKQIQELVMGSLMESFGKEVSNTWSSPIKGIINEVIAENREEIKKQFQSALDESFGDKEFTKIVRQEFKHKVAKTMIGSLESEVDKAVNVIRQDPTMRARMILAIEKLIK